MVHRSPPLWCHFSFGWLLTGIGGLLSSKLDLCMQNLLQLSPCSNLCQFQQKLSFSRKHADLFISVLTRALQFEVARSSVRASLLLLVFGPIRLAACQSPCSFVAGRDPSTFSSRRPRHLVLPGASCRRQDSRIGLGRCLNSCGSPLAQLGRRAISYSCS